MAPTKTHPSTRHISSEPSHSLGRRAKPRRFHFTERRIADLPVPTNGKRDHYYDDEVRGLGVRVGQFKKTFILYRMIGAKPERIIIAPCADISVVEARKRATEMNAAISRGNNPAEDRRRIRDEMTLEELFQTFIDLFARENKRTWRDDVSMFKLHLHGWRLRKISHISRMDVITLHAHIGRTSGHYAANRVVELLSAMFNRAIRDWEWQGTNPAQAITPFKERKRERFMDAHELPAFFQSLSEELNYTIRDYILVSLLSGARRSNVQEMRWDEIDWKRALWLIPAEKAKGDTNIVVALVPVVMQILENRKASSMSPWVFPGSGKTGHLVEPKGAWARILARAGLTDLRLHDLRRTLGSWQAATAASLPIIGKSLGHKSLEATKVYARLSLNPVRESVSRATPCCSLAGSRS